MLTFETADFLRTEPDVRRFWHLAVLMAVRDKADRVEIRFTDSGGVLYHRVDGRDWELGPVPEDLFDELKPELRKVSRLVSPERPGVQVIAGVPDARFEPWEIGWLTYQLGSNLFDLAVRIDPREPWGGITLDLEKADELAGHAAVALADYYSDEDAE